MVRTRDLLIKIGVENSLPMSKIEEIVEKLESEWYSDTEHLFELDDSQWKNLNIPVRLVNLIRKYLNEDPACLRSARQEVLAKLFSGLQMEKLSACVSALQQICFNLSAFNDLKYRSMNLLNPAFQQKIGSVPLAMQYLKLLGFQNDAKQIFVQNPDQALFLSELEELNKLAVKYNLPEKQIPEKFNPFKSSISTTNFSVPKLAEGQNNFSSISDEISRLKENREKAINHIQINRDPRIYRLLNEEAKISSQYTEDPEADEEIIRKNIQSFMVQREKSTVFQNKRKNELEKLRSQEFCVKVGVKIRFPDGFILEGSFSVKETMKQVYEFVRQYIIYQKDFYLFTTPPKEIIKESKESLKKFMPAVIFQFSWTDESKTDSYLKSRL